MPNTAGAKKALRSSLKKRDLNRSQRSALRTAIKKVRAAIAAEDETVAKEAFRFSTKKLDQAADKNLIHKNTAARVKSRIAAAMKKQFAPEKVAAAT